MSSARLVLLPDGRRVPLAGLLRVELGRYAATLGTRRAAPPRVWVGTPGGERLCVADHGDRPDRCPDGGWATDLVDRALDGLEHPLCGWVTRTGPLDATDHDLVWCAATRAGFARHGLDVPGFYVLNRRGWADLLGEESVTFHRVRER